MNIAITGIGNIISRLAKHGANAGYEILLGVRDVANPAHASPAPIAKDGIKECFAEDAPDKDVQNLIASHKADAFAPMAAPVSLTTANLGGVKKFTSTQQKSMPSAIHYKK